MPFQGCRCLGRSVGAVLLAAAAGCGGKSDPGGTSSGATGGAATYGVGGIPSTSAAGGVSSGGKTFTGLGGATGGTKLTGLGGVTGGTTAIGVGGATGGTKPTGLGGATGGAIAIGAGGATGGKSVTSIGGSGGAATGGTTVIGVGGATGGSVATGGSAGHAGSMLGVAGVAGANLADFCVGDTNKVSYQGQNLMPAAFNYQSMVALNCCNGFGVGLHTRDALGFDLALEVIYEVTASGPSPGQYAIGSTMRPSVTLRKLGVTATSLASNTTGLMVLDGDFYGSAAWGAGFCLVVNASAAEFAGTRVYVPRATMMSYGWTKRFQIYQLADPAINPKEAESIGLGSLVLAATPWLSLAWIAYVEQSATKFDITLGDLGGSSLRSQLDSVTSEDRPFVVMADSVPVYLGTFFRGISAAVPVGPMIRIDAITDDRVPISAPMSSTSDPRSDPRILKALSESGKLVP